MSETADIERFAALLDETGTGRHHRQPEDVDPELLAMLEATRGLPRRAGPTVRPEFRERLLAELMAAWPKQGPGATNHQPVPATHDDQPAVSWPGNGVPAPRRSVDQVAVPAAVSAEAPTQAIRALQPRRGPRTRLAMVIGLATGALAISGVSMASTDARPGDALYPVKGWGEQAQLLLAGSDAERGRLHLDFARVRLVEARGGGADAAALLGDMDQETTEGVRLIFTSALTDADASVLGSVTSFVQQQRADLTRLGPGDLTAASLDLLAAVETRAHEVQAALASSCPAGPADRFGPVPTC